MSPICIHLHPSYVYIGFLSRFENPIYKAVVFFLSTASLFFLHLIGKHSNVFYYQVQKKSIKIMDKTVIATHGSLPRDAISFAKIANKEASDQALASGSITTISEHFEANESKFREYVRDHLLDEFWYFIDIGRNEGFVRRFDFVRRRLFAVKNSRCAQKQGLYLIIGPKHLKAFKIRSVRSWFPEDRSDYLDLMPGPKEDHALIFDYDLYPFWHPERGLSPYTSCDTEDEQSP